MNLKGDQCVIIASCGTSTTTTSLAGQPPTIPNRCECIGMNVINRDGTDCVSACATGEVKDLQGKRCVLSCPANSANTTASPTRCVCNTGYFFDQAGTACVNACPSGSYLNIERTQCISSCPANQV